MRERKSATRRVAEATTPLEPRADEGVTAGVRELRDHLSQYLELVKGGRPVTITEHGTVIATIVPMRFSARTMELYRQGRVGLPTLPKGDPREWDKIEVERHALGALDAIHLASALSLREPGEDVALVTFDRRMRDAALAEGLLVLPEDA